MSRDLFGVRLPEWEPRQNLSGTHAQRLTAALGGEPAAWDYLGDYREDPYCRLTCACGHPGCRWLFALERRDAPGRKVWVGSVCVGAYAHLPATTVARVERAAATLAAEARRARNPQPETPLFR